MHIYTYIHTLAIQCTCECNFHCEMHYIEKKLNHQPVPALCNIYTCGLLMSRVKEMLHGNCRGLKK